MELHQLAAEQASISPAALLPGVGLAAGAAAVKFYCYSQLEVITAKMLSKYVPSGGGAAGARVIQLGGGTRELVSSQAATHTHTNTRPHHSRSCQQPCRAVLLSEGRGAGGQCWRKG